MQKQDYDSLRMFSNSSWRLISGGIAGAVSRSCVAPMERLVILKQTNNPNYYGQPILRSMIYMYNSEGLLSFFKGNGANCFRIAPYQAIEFTIFDQAKNVIIPQISFLNHNFLMLIFGALSGAIATTSVYPFDLVKTILSVQTNNVTNQQYRGIFLTMYQILLSKGIHGVFIGLPATLFGISLFASLKLTFFQIVRNNLSSILPFENRFKGIIFLISYTIILDFKNLIYGALAGCSALSVSYPTDVIRRRLQVQILNNLPRTPYLQIVKTIYKSQGIRAFYAGIFATYWKVAPSTAIAFTINEKLKSLKNLN